MWLGAQNPDCCNGDFEDEKRGNGSAMTGSIKMKCFPPFQDEGEVVAAWSEAQLVKYLDGRLELKGASREYRA